MSATYAAASSYEDRGTVITEYSGAHPNTDKLSFQTAFVRDQRLRFEYRHDLELNGRVLGSQRYTIWSDFVHTYSEWTVRPGIVDDGPDLSLPLAAAAGVSSLSSTAIPSMLLPDLVGRGPFLRLRAAAVEGSEAVDGHTCWRVKGNIRKQPVTLWIDRDSHVLRRVQTGNHFAEFDTIETMAFEPVINRPVAETSLQPPDIAANPPTVRKPLPPSPWIGLMFDPNTTKIRALIPGSPADRGGLLVGDEIVAIGGQRVVNASEVSALVGLKAIGEKLVVTVSRNAAKVDVTITLAERKSTDHVARDALLDKPAPAFDAPVIVGSGKAKLAALSGSVLVIDFWSSDCDACSAVVPRLNALVSKYPALRVIGLSGDDADEIRQYAADNKIRYTLASDVDNKIFTSYWGTGWPMLVVVDKAGVVRAVETGAGGAGAIEDAVGKLLR